MVQRRTRAFIGLLGLVLITVGVVNFGHAAAKEKPRFTISSNDPNWVLDRTTSLQWYVRGDAFGATDFFQGDQDCRSLGARLPEMKELISLVDYSVAYPGPALPAGHPFVNVQLDLYLSATPMADLSSSYWYLDSRSGAAYPGFRINSGWVWCVR